MDKLETINIYEQMKESFMEYSMSVIISRALPDLRDGLKPVHRRILYTMFEAGYTPDKAYQKCAKTVGAVIGNYHPHGDTAAYDSMVRMAQDFSYRHVLVDGHGNFGSIEGFGAAAYRYTESRLSKISMELLRDINKGTVEFDDNFDGTLKEPSVLPSRFPNILVNGTMGIAVGMATNIPPHNLSEVINGCIAYIDNEDISLEELMEHIKGPDFPTGGIILGNSGIRKAYDTGKGTVTLRARTEIVEKGNRNDIVITEIPYQTNKKSLKNKIAELVGDKLIEGISELRDESSIKNGVRIVLEIKKDANANVVLNNLFKYTQLQTSYGITLLMLDDKQPKILGLKDIISKYIDYQKSVIIRRTRFELEKAEKRAHILEGYKIALDHIDDIIKIIKESNDDAEIMKKFDEKYGLTEIQSQAILQMQLRRLSGLERKKIEEELEELMRLIEDLKAILASNERIMGIIKDEMAEIRDKYGDERRTDIDMTAIEYIEDESLIPVDDIVITLTNKGYIKRATSDTYKTQNRGGVGVKGMGTNEEDFVENIINMTTHDYLLFFSNKGKVYRIKGYEVPLYNRQAKGLPIVNLLPIEQDESVTVMLKIGSDEELNNLVFCTQKGLVKRTAIEEFSNIRTNGKIAITLKEDDQLISVKKTDGNKQILIASSNGRMVRFDENEIRVMGRTASGVKGIDLGDGICVGCEIAEPGQQILVVTEKGYGKKTAVEEYRMTHRGSKGVKALNITEKNGNIVSFKSTSGDRDLMIMTDSGIIIRLKIEQVSNTGRVAQGVRLINLKDDQKVATVALIQVAEDYFSTEEETEKPIISTD